MARDNYTNEDGYKADELIKAIRDCRSQITTDVLSYGRCRWRYRDYG